jgi:hypothetical protein
MRLARTKAYRALFTNEANSEKLAMIRRAVNCSMPTGSGRFKTHIEKAISRNLGYLRRGRPARSAKPK